MQITNDPSIVSKVNVVVLAVPSFAHGQFLRPSLFMKPGTIVAVMPARSGGDILFSPCLVKRFRSAPTWATVFGTLAPLFTQECCTANAV